MANTTERFLITADVAEGIEGHDKSSASVWDVYGWEQVAHWHGYCDPYEFADILKWMGIMYNWATIAIETNYPGNATYLKLFKSLEYPKLWKDPATSEPWKTTSKTRPLAISALREAIRESTIKINSPDTIIELNTFVRNDNGKLEASGSSHDDCVMDAAIAAYILKNTAFSDEALESVRKRPMDVILNRVGKKKKKNQGIV